MTRKSSIVNNSTEQSTISVKSEANQIRGLPRYEIERLEKEMKKCNHSKTKSIYRRLIIGFLCCLITSASLTTIIISSRLIYRTKQVQNYTIFVVQCPAFVTYFSISWLILFIPVHIYFQYLKGQDKPLDVIYSIRQSLVLYPCDNNYRIRSIIAYTVMSILWHVMAYCWFRGVAYVSSLNIAAIFCFNSCLNYLLQWVVMHKKFIAIRIMAFILASSGIIINIYSNENGIWQKVLLTTSASIFAVMGVVMKYFQVLTNSRENSKILSVIGILNVLLTWPIFFGLSVMSSLEPLDWSQLSWGFLFGLSFGSLGVIITLEIASTYSTRFTRSLHFVVSIPLSYIIERYWVSGSTSLVTYHNPTGMEITSVVIVTVAVFINSIPHKFLTTVHHRVFPVAKVRQVTGRRVSLATRSQLLGGNTVVGNGNNLIGGTSTGLMNTFYSSFTGGGTAGGGGREPSVIELKSTSRQVSLT